MQEHIVETETISTLTSVYYDEHNGTLLTKTDGNYSSAAVYYADLIYLYAQERSIFFSVYLLLYCITIIGNVCAILVTWQRKHRFLQKTCIISLAISDLITGTFIMVYNADDFVKPYITWGLGKLMCHLVPTVQIFGGLCSCVAIVSIALDRYNNVARKKNCDPPLWACVLTAVIIWGICAGISYPIYNLFRYGKFYLMEFDKDSIYPKYTEAFACVSTTKTNLMIYKISITVLIFLPLISIFCWLYYKIACIVWRHRKPLFTNLPKKSETTSEGDTSTTNSNDLTSKSASSSSDQHIKSIMKKKRISAERKVRTFKIIIVLVLAFVTCRLPYWLFDIIRVVQSLNEHKHWIMRYTFNSINLLNCALNPFLYTFLNQTIALCKKFFDTLKDFMCKICCCCCSNADFEEFEQENPFVVGTYEKKTSSGVGQNPKTERIPRVKFKETTRVQLFDKHQEIFKDVKRF